MAKSRKRQSRETYEVRVSAAILATVPVPMPNALATFKMPLPPLGPCALRSHAWRPTSVSRSAGPILCLLRLHGLKFFM
jgi:hypothetical protein